MIVQSAETGNPHFVILQTDHARMSGQLARAFGNASFADIVPREVVAYAVAHHDEGWAELDARMLQDPDTGLPYHLTKTPLPRIIETGSGSPILTKSTTHTAVALQHAHVWPISWSLWFVGQGVHRSDSAAIQGAGDGAACRRIGTARTAQRDWPLILVTAGWIVADFLFTNYKLLQFLTRWRCIFIWFTLRHGLSRHS